MKFSLYYSSDSVLCVLSVTLLIFFLVVASCHNVVLPPSGDNKHTDQNELHGLYVKPKIQPDLNTIQIS